MYYNPEDIRVEEMPKPRIGPSDLLVEMHACGLCGSDLMDWYLKDRAPLVLGHEPAGVVVEIGPDVKEFEVGDRVFPHHHVACLNCYYCRRGDYTLCEKFRETHLDPGGFAEYFRVPRENLLIDTLKIPEEISFEEATLIEPTACCIKGLKEAGLQPGDSVAIVGAGPTGLILLELAKVFGATDLFVTDLIDYRLRVAERLGASLALNPSEEDPIKAVKTRTDGRGADVVVVTAPNLKALESGLDLCRKGGTLCVFAPTPPDVYLKLSSHRIFFSELRVVGSYSTSHLETRMALDLMRSRRIDVKKLITHRFPLEEISEAFKLASTDKNCLKVVITRGG
jgi:L-iditol 2-dehydrogenase